MMEESGGLVPFEWVDTDEWAALEQALAAATGSKQANRVSAFSSSEGLDKDGDTRGEAGTTASSGRSDRAASSAPPLSGNSVDGDVCSIGGNTTTQNLPIILEFKYDNVVQASNSPPKEDLEPTMRQLTTTSSHQCDATDADTDIIDTIQEKETKTPTESKDTNNLSKRVCRTLPRWGQNSLMQLESQTQPEVLQGVLSAEGLHKMVQTNLSQLTNPWPMVKSACQAKVPAKIPSFQFKGQVVYSKTHMEVDAAVHKILEIIKAKRRASPGNVPMGFDLEWKTSFERGEASGKVAVVQLCLESSRCDVMHIVYSGIPPSLACLLEDSSILKTGVGSYGDATKLHQDYGVQARGVVDLSIMANQKLGGRSGKRWSLSSLAQELTCKKVDKVRSIQCGNWETYPLSQAQLLYAATDAFVSLYLYQILETFTDCALEDKQDGSNSLTISCANAS